jgi:MSHA biogenesis protein MshP
MIHHKLQKGFSLITAIFLLTVVALLMSSMINLSGVQHSTVVMSVQGARAFQAARSALEYGIFLALNSGTCNNSEALSFAATEPALQAFDISLGCTSTTHDEGIGTVTVYELSATASSGSYALGAVANPDYVSRSIRVTVSNQPP